MKVNSHKVGIKQALNIHYTKSTLLYLINSIKRYGSK